MENLLELRLVMSMTLTPIPSTASAVHQKRHTAALALSVVDWLSTRITVTNSIPEGALEYSTFHNKYLPPTLPGGVLLICHAAHPGGICF